MNQILKNFIRKIITIGLHTTKVSDVLSGYFEIILRNVYGKKEMFHLTTHSTHFIYYYMASEIW